MCVYGWGADWNDGFGFLSQIVDSRTMRPGAANMNVKLPEVDKMLDEAMSELDQGKREADWAAIDKKVMEEALIYPGVYAKSVLVRPKNATNVFVNDGVRHATTTSRWASSSSPSLVHRLPSSKGR